MLARIGEDSPLRFAFFGLWMDFHRLDSLIRLIFAYYHPLNYPSDIRNDVPRVRIHASIHVWNVGPRNFPFIYIRRQHSGPFFSVYPILVIKTNC